MKKIRDLVKKHLKEPIVDIVRPHAFRFYKETRARGDHAYHYRYPSPGSYDIENKNIEQKFDFRVPYKDSIHDIKYFQHVSAKEPENQYFATNGLTADGEIALESELIRGPRTCQT